MENAYLEIAKGPRKYKVIQDLMSKIAKENLMNQHKLQMSRKVKGIGRANKIKQSTERIQNKI